MECTFSLQVFEQPSGGGVFTGNVLSSALTDVADSEEVTSFTVYDSVVELPPWPTAKTQEDSFDQPTPCDAAPSGRPVRSRQPFDLLSTRPPRRP